MIYGLIDPRTKCLRYIGKTHKRREKRLEDHLKLAEDGNSRAVYQWIRKLKKERIEPEIFILEKIPPDRDWRLAEKKNIEFWRHPSSVVFPYIHPPQTPKSKEIEIRSVSLLNQTDGG